MRYPATVGRHGPGVGAAFAGERSRVNSMQKQRRFPSVKGRFSSIPPKKRPRVDGNRRFSAKISQKICEKVAPRVRGRTILPLKNRIRADIRKFFKNVLTLPPVLIGSFSTPKRGRWCSLRLQRSLLRHRPRRKKGGSSRASSGGQNSAVKLRTMDNGRRVGGWFAKAAIRWRGEGGSETTSQLGRQHTSAIFDDIYRNRGAQTTTVSRA
jgi:hypothetical protein